MSKCRHLQYRHFEFLKKFTITESEIENPGGNPTMHDRKEATIEEWGRLYQQATILGEMKPWKLFQQDQLIALRFPKNSGTIYSSIQGSYGESSGVSFYEGQTGFDDLMAVLISDQLISSPEYAKYTQNCLSVQWGSRADLSAAQRDTIKKLGYQYRGSGKWLYFLSYRDGYIPFNPDKKEVKSLTRYISRLIKAIEWYKANNIEMDFAEDEIYEFSHNAKTDVWEGNSIIAPPDAKAAFLDLGDPVEINALKTAKKAHSILEIDLIHYGHPVKDSNFERPINPLMIFIADHQTKEILVFRTSIPGGKPGSWILNLVADYILTVGKPKQILIRNHVLNRYLKYICKLCDIEVTIDLDLSAIDRYLNKYQDSSFFKGVVSHFHKRSQTANQEN